MLPRECCQQGKMRAQVGLGHSPPVPSYFWKSRRLKYYFLLCTSLWLQGQPLVRTHRLFQKYLHPGTELPGSHPCKFPGTGTGGSVSTGVQGTRGPVQDGGTVRDPGACPHLGSCRHLLLEPGGTHLLRGVGRLGGQPG